MYHMTSLSQYLRAERPDMTEPASFYAPGAWGWEDPRVRLCRSKAIETIEDDIRLVPAVPEEDADQEH